jgi:hypothetical protein
MEGLLTFAAVVFGLVIFDVLALRFGADTRPAADHRPDCWW